MYTENVKESTEKFLELKSNYSNISGYNVSIQKSNTFLYISYEQVGLKLKSQYHLH